MPPKQLPLYLRAAFWASALLVPYILIMLAVRLLISPLYAHVQYRLPNFPPDPFGFTLQQRLEYADYSIRYLTNAAEISFLGDLTFPDGSPLFNQRELRHMLDVKILVRQTLAVWYVALVVVAVSAGLFFFAKKARAFRVAMGYGGWFTIALIPLALLAVFIDFDWLFTEFHRLFFEGDTWLFYHSDTLIRLFPLPFWMNAFVIVFLFTIVSSALLIFQGRLAQKKMKINTPE